jgi:serine/threonine protein kinase
VRGELLVDRYRLMTLLGSGGTGQVWRARDEALERDVAVKVVSRLAADAAMAERFTCEARSAARLSHPGIVAIFDFGEVADGRLFLVMELVEGRSLAQVLREDGRLPTERGAAVGAQVACALAAAHERGVIHRDIKPANLLIGRDGTVKVADFGLAMLAEGNTTALTTTGVFVGTASYTAPERAMGQRGTAASDLYSLGCVLYEALSGRPPFRIGNVVELLYQHVHKQPEPLRRIRTDVSPALELTVHALLAKEPAERPTDAASTAMLLSAPDSEDATSVLAALRANRMRLPSRPARQRWLPQVAFGVLAAAVFAGTFALSWSQSSMEPTGQAGQATSPAPVRSASHKPVAGSSPSVSDISPETRTGIAPADNRTSPTSSPASPSILAADLTRRLRSQASTMEPRLAREVQRRADALSRTLREGKVKNAADGVRELQKRLAKAQNQGKWAGDMRTKNLLSQLAGQLSQGH